MSRPADEKAMGNKVPVSFSDIAELLHSNAIEGETQIAHFRFFVIGACLLVVLAIAISSGVLTASEYADFFSLSVALFYNCLLIWMLKAKRYYRRFLGFLSSTIDISIISLVIYFAQYGANSSVITIMASSATIVYLPIILFSLRRHDPPNSLYTGCLAGAAYFGIIWIMARGGAFGILLRSDTGLRVQFDLANECAKPALLIVAGILGFITARNYDYVLRKGIQTEGERLRIRHLFDVYVSQELVEKILNNEIKMEGEKREITVMFVDIKDFTALCGGIDPETMVRLLCDFCSRSEAIIARHRGFIDKFIGDAIMVLFGAPLAMKDHREQAVSCAVELCRMMEGMTAMPASHCLLEVGIGINTGEVIIGTVGSANRQSYTALGDTVNVASRLERLTRQLHKKVLIGESVLTPATAHLTEEPIWATIRGKTEGIRVFPLHL